MYERYGLQSFDDEVVRAQVLSTFEQMHERLEATRGLVDPDRFYEMRYEDLVEDPVKQVETVYEYLELGDFKSIRPAVEKFAERSRRYQTNEYEQDPESRRIVTQCWSAYTQKYGYETSEAPISPSTPTV